jgi:OFA family oxalate/formate antiporter-like MFS transporter
MSSYKVSGTGASRWARLIGATIVLMVLGVLYAWSIFRQPLGEMFPGWTPVDMSWVFTITMLGFLIGGVVSGRLMLKLPPRYIVMIGAALLLVGFFGASRINIEDPDGSLVMMYVFYGGFCGLGIGMPYNAILSCLLKWFPGKEGLASGIMLVGFGFGGLVLGSAINGLIAGYGLKTTFVILAVGVAAIAGGGSFIIRLPSAPSGETFKPMGSAGDGGANDVVNYTSAQMVRTSTFIILVLWMISGVTAGLMVMNSAATIAIFYGSAASAGLIATVFNGVGRIFFGTLFDRAGGRIAMITGGIAIILSGGLMLLGALTGNLPLILIGLPFATLGYGGAPVITAAFISRSFGPENYASNLSITNFTVVVSSVAGPLLSGKLQKMDGGAFTSTFIAIGILGFVALVFAFFVKPRKAK